jgi:CCR4-NOT transcription complex subunit 1
MSTFDPLEEIRDFESISGLLIQLRNAFDDKNDDDEYIFGIIQESCSFGRDFFQAMFTLANSSEITKILRCVKETGIMRSVWTNLSDAIVHCVRGNCLVVKHDMRMFFDVLSTVVRLVGDDIESLNNYAAMLHVLRPLQMPMFSFVWVELATDRQFVFRMVPNSADFMTTLLCDFVAAVCFVIENTEPFERLYRGLLRFLLVLAHDFPSFLTAAVPEVVAVLSQSFVQVRNIVLSAQPAGTRAPPIAEARRALANVACIDSFVPAQQPFRGLCEQWRFAEAVQNAIVFDELVGQFETKPNTISAFVVFLGNTGLPSVSMKQIQTAVESIHIFYVLSNLIEKSKVDVIVTIVNVMIDQLRYPSRTTLFFYSALLNLFNSERVSKGQLPLGLNEIILRAVVERAAAPPPHPWGLRLLLSSLLGSNALWVLPFVRRSDAVTKFLQATAVAFGLSIP